jgi:hypothetical protein
MVSQYCCVSPRPQVSVEPHDVLAAQHDEPHAA